MNVNYEVVSISAQKAIHQIEQVYHAGYNPNWPDFDAREQLLVCESIAESEVAAKKQSYNPPLQKKQPHPNKDVNVIGYDSYKRSVNSELTESKRKVISELKTLDYRTSPLKIASLLQTLFAEYNSIDGWWLYVAQHWNPRAINRVINYMVKVYENGTISIQNPAAYFTSLIQKRKRRRSL